VGDDTFRVLESEAKRRDVTVQQLLRAVIVPEWVRENPEVNPASMTPREIAPHMNAPVNLPRSTRPVAADTR